MLNVVKWQDFLKKTTDRKIICFGAGKRLLELENLPAGYQVINCTEFIIDNDENKKGKDIFVLGRKFKINSLEIIKNIECDRYVVLITIANGYYKIVDQLKQLNLYEKLDIYCLTHMIALFNEQQAMSKNIPNNIKLCNKMIIPKKIHYCWFGGNPIPDKYKKWMESWEKYCPDYEIIQWNENNYDVTKNKYMFDAYRAHKWGFVPDYARLDIIYNYGGIYLDTDVELIDNLDDLLYQNGFAGFESNKYVALGLGFGAKKHNPLIKELMEDYNNREFSVNKNMIASPVIQTELMIKKGLKTNGEYQVLKDMTIFPEKMFCGKSLSSRRIKLKAYSKSIHHYDGSWLDDQKRNAMKKLEEDFNNVLVHY